MRFSLAHLSALESWLLRCSVFVCLSAVVFALYCHAPLSSLPPFCVSLPHFWSPRHTLDCLTTLLIALPCSWMPRPLVINLWLLPLSCPHHLFYHHHVDCMEGEEDENSWGPLCLQLELRKSWSPPIHEKCARFIMELEASSSASKIIIWLLHPSMSQSCHDIDLIWMATIHRCPCDSWQIRCGRDHSLGGMKLWVRNKRRERLFISQENVRTQGPCTSMDLDDSRELDNIVGKVQCIICTYGRGRHVTMGPKLGSLKKYARKWRAKKDLLHIFVKEGEHYVNKKCHHLTTTVVYTNYCLSGPIIMAHVCMFNPSHLCLQLLILFNFKLGCLFNACQQDLGANGCDVW